MNRFLLKLTIIYRPENPGLFIGWSILNPAWGNLQDSKFGPNLYNGTAPVYGLYWNVGCEGLHLLELN